MYKGIVYFIGAGPGDPKLLTLKAVEIISKADVIVFADSLINPDVLKFARDSAEIYKSYGMRLEEIVEIMANSARDGKLVARLQSGDPSIYGAIWEQMRELEARGIPFEIVPGVSSLFSSSASLKVELTVPGVSQTVIITRRAGKTPVPERENLRSLASHKATMAIFLSVGSIDKVVEDLVEGGFSKDTRASVVYRSTWKDEKIIKGTLGNIADKVKREKISKQAIIIVGDILDKKVEGKRSRLYGGWSP